jgi:glycosyltransferase involved in cell wall biosynthesis
MFLSVIIPTRNRAPLLRRALDSLLVQTYPADLFEVVIVDNGSSDQTASVCALFSKESPNARHYYDDRPGLHVGRHVGMKQGRGDILVYADDDIRAVPTWLEGVAESFQDPQAGLVGGKSLPEFESPPPAWVDALWQKTEWGRTIPYFSILDFGDEIRELPSHYVWGCNYSIRKSLLVEIGGFHPDGMPNDFLAYRGDGESAVSKSIHRMGYKAIYNPKASVFHYVMKERMTRKYLFHRSYIQGISDSYTNTRELGGFRDDEQGYAKYLLQTMKIYLSVLLGESHGISRTIHAGYWAGYRFHQAMVRKDPALLEWVLKKHYRDEAQ